MNEKQYIQTELDRLPGSSSGNLPGNLSGRLSDNASDTLSRNEFGDQQEYESVSWFVLIRELVQVVVPAVLLAFLVQFFLAQPTVVYGQSMEPNLSPRQRLIIDKVSYRLARPKRHDIVVIDLPTMEQLLVKRIIGLPGETLEMSNGTIYVNGMPLEDSFSNQGMSGYEISAFPLGDHEYFVLGDNRGNSNDSRSFGPVSDEYFVGRVWLRYWPLNQLTYF